MKTYTFDQHSEDWHKIRLGKITGTRLKDIFKSDNLSLIDQLIAETVSNQIEDTYISEAMQRGIDYEPLARNAYADKNKVEITQVGFIEHDTRNWFGKSPDGLIKSSGKFIHEIEIKCPDTKTHVKYIRMNQLPNDYKYQVYSSFLINQDLESLDFISFDPRFHVKPMFTFTTYRETILEELKKTEDELLKFRDKWERYYDQIIF